MAPAISFIDGFGMAAAYRIIAMHHQAVVVRCHANRRTLLIKSLFGDAKNSVLKIYENNIISPSNEWARAIRNMRIAAAI